MNEPTGEPWLRCPKCDYDLRGLSENRCPECGDPFDANQLMAEFSRRTYSSIGRITFDYFAYAMFMFVVYLAVAFLAFVALGPIAVLVLRSDLDTLLAVTAVVFGVGYLIPARWLLCRQLRALEHSTFKRMSTASILLVIVLVSQTLFLLWIARVVVLVTYRF